MLNPQDDFVQSPGYEAGEKNGGGNRPVYPPGTPVHNYTTPLHETGYQVGQIESRHYLTMIIILINLHFVL